MLLNFGVALKDSMKATSITASSTKRKTIVASPWSPLRALLGTWPSPAIVPVTSFVGHVRSAPDGLAQHDNVWLIGRRRQPVAQGHDFQRELLLDGACYA